jgi:hypothetical protein
MGWSFGNSNNILDGLATIIMVLAWQNNDNSLGSWHG